MTTAYEDQEGGYVAVRSPEQLARLQAEIGEVPEEVDRHIQLLRSWILAQPHFRGRTERRGLHKALRWAKYNQDKARLVCEQVIKFVTSPALQDIVLKNGDGLSDGMREVLQAGVFTILPKRTKEGCRVFVTRVGKWDPSKHTFGDLFKVALLVNEAGGMDDTLLLEGKIQIDDFKDTGARHITSIPFAKLKLIGSFHKAVFEDRIKATHVVNASTLTNGLLELTRFFQSEKLRHRTHVHWRGVESVAEQVDEEVLPNEYGGTAGPIDDICEKSNSFVMRHLDLMEHICIPPGSFYDESKKLQTSDMLGTHGTYRKLSD